jgi:DNA-binding response OmpR family regulator
MRLAVKWETGKGTRGRRSNAATRPPVPSHPIVQQETRRGVYNVLVVDDDVNLTRLMSTILRTEGMTVVTATDGRVALDMAERSDVDAIILDLRMPNLDGRGFYQELRSRGIETPVLISSAYEARQAQHELGAQGSIEKPFDPEVLISELQRVIDPDGG